MKRRPNIAIFLAVLLFPFYAAFLIVVAVLKLLSLITKFIGYFILLILTSPFLVMGKFFPQKNVPIVGPKYGNCFWLKTPEGHKTALDVHMTKGFVRLMVDPAAPHRLLLQEKGYWRVQVGCLPSGAPIWRQGDRIYPHEYKVVLQCISKWLQANGLGKPIAVLCDDIPDWKEWRFLCTRNAALFQSIEITTKTEFSRNTHAFTEERVPFGEPLMRQVSTRLRAGGELSYFHRDYCGHGLFFFGGKFAVATVSDGRRYTTLKEWDSEEEFISYFATLDDFICSGAESSNAIFATNDEWEMGNQRLTRQRLQEFAGQ